MFTPKMIGYLELLSVLGMHASWTMHCSIVISGLQNAGICN